MRVRLGSLVERFRASLFLVPMLAVVAAIVIASVAIGVDRGLDPSSSTLPLGFTSTVESARALLGTIAGATITFAAIAFSVSLLIIQQASSQYSPRVVHTLFRDPFNKRVMGLVVGTFTYCLLILRSVRTALEDGGDPVIPNLSVAIAVVLGIVTILAIVAFIDHSRLRPRVVAGHEPLGPAPRGLLPHLRRSDRGQLVGRAPRWCDLRLQRPLRRQSLAQRRSADSPRSWLHLRKALIDSEHLAHRSCDRRADHHHMKHRIPLSAVMVALLFAGLGACADGTPPAPSPSGAGSVSGAPSAGTEPPPGTTFPLVHGSSTGGTALGPPVTTPPSSPPALPPRPDPAPPTSTVGDRQPRSDVLGVHAGLGRRSDAVGAAQDLGVGWVRVNTTVDGTSGGAVDTYRRWLDAGFNLVITLNNVDLAAIDTTYGTPKEYVHAGFPTTDPARLREDVSDLIGPLAPYLDGGRQVIVQVENEVGDVRNGGAGNIYWRGTTDQYLALERVVYDSVKQIDTRFGVSLSGLTSSAVDGLIDAASPVHGYQTSRVDRWLTEGRYDAIDLHFYGCTAQISAGARWAAASLPAGKYWISTENAGPTPMCSSTFSDWRSDPSRFEDVKAAQVRDRSAACVDGDARVCLWFSLFNLDGEVDTFNHLGLLGTDGAKTPAYDAYKQFIA